MGITTGILPAAATTGMLLGFGMRDGAPARVFNAIGAILVGQRGLGADFSAATIVGVLLHVAVMLLCGVVYTALVAETEQHRFSWAIAIGAAAVVLMLVFARLFGGGIALVLSLGNLLEIGAVIVVALPIGMRLALPQVYRV
jgi:hypothetical protein